MQLTCQLYQYSEHQYLLTKNSAQYYATNFVDIEIKKDNENRVNWLNYHSINDREQIELLAENLKIDKLTVEDIYSEYKRPKIEEYPNYIFFSIKSALIINSNLNQERISFILGENYLISFQERSSDHFPEVRERIEKKKGKIRFKGPDFLLFRLLEAIIDNYFESLDEIILNIEKLESQILVNSKSDFLKQIELEKRKLIELRKIIFPLKDIVSQLDKTKTEFIKEENLYYFSDLKDNCLTLLDEIDSNKQILEGMTNLYYAVQGQRMNEIMKLLTIVSAIFIPLTFIVGVYGMNFENMPELKTKNGYFVTLFVMFLLAVLLLFYFRKRGWMKNK
jgi:magnesium transporter